MEKIMVKFSAPAVSLEIDVAIPAHLRVRTIIQLLIESIHDLSAMPFFRSGSEMLCSGENASTLDWQSTLKEQGVMNGDHLFLI